MLPGEPKRNQWLQRCRVKLKVEPKLVKPHLSRTGLLVNFSIRCVVNFRDQREVTVIIVLVQLAHRLSRVDSHLVLDVLYPIVSEDEGCMRRLNVEHQQQQQNQLVVCRDMLVAVGDVANVDDC